MTATLTEPDCTATGIDQARQLRRYMSYAANSARRTRIARIRRQIADGTYDVESRLDQAADAMIDELLLPDLAPAGAV